MAARKRQLTALLAVLVGVGLGLTVFRTPEPARTGLALLTLLCSERRPSERQRQLERGVASELEFELEADSGEVQVRSYTERELPDLLAEFNALRPRCEVSLRDWRVRDGAAGHSTLEGELEYSESQVGDLHAERRTLRAQFRSERGGVRLERIRLGPVERRLPEARP
jgi:hypothetical protein